MPVVSLDDAADPRVADYGGIPDPELARARGVFVAEGRLVVRRLLESRFVARSVMVTATALDAVADVVAARPGLPVFVVPQGLMNTVAGFNVHRGCLAIGERPAATSWDELAGAASPLVALERVGNADNVGATFRAAAAFGAGGVLLDGACADPLYRKAIRTSMGASLQVRFAAGVPWPDALGGLRARGWIVVGLTPVGAQPLATVLASAHAQKVVLVLGHEGDGLTRQGETACTHLARIPMAGAVDSLNVAMAAGIALYELQREGAAVMDRRWDVIGVGENSIDHVLRLPALPTLAEATKFQVRSMTHEPGGQIVTALCTCTAMGLRASYIGIFGDDEDGVRLRATLASRGLDLSHALVRPAANRSAVILVDERNGDRVVMAHREAALALAPDLLPRAALEGARVVHVDGVDEAASIAAARLARVAGAQVTCDLDAIGAGTGALLAELTIPILAQGLPEAITGEADSERALRKLPAPHARLRCVTMGAQGALLLDGDRVVRCDAPAVSVVDTTGAGDVFRGAFIVALLRGDPPDRLLRFANAAAALSCTRPGALGGVPTMAEVERLMGRV